MPASGVSSSASSTHSVKSARDWIVNRIKEHHQSVNAAHKAYYGALTPTTPAPSQPFVGAEAAAASGTHFSPRAVLDSAVAAIKKHHESVSAAHDSYYGMGVSTKPAAKKATENVMRAH